eukprot:56347_1
MANPQVFCDQHEEIGVIYHLYIIPIIELIAAISMIPCICVFIKAYVDGNLKTTKLLFLSGICLFIVCFMQYIAWIFYNICHCYECHHYFNVISHIHSQLISAQTMLVLAVLYLRLHFIFKNTMMALSKSITIVLSTYYSVTSTAVILSYAAAYSNEYAKVWINSTVSGTLILSLVIILNGLFVYKMCKIYRLADDTCKNDKFIAISVKTSLLGLISLCTTFLMYFMATVNRSLVLSIHLNFVFYLCCIADTYTNFMCILLSYQYFNSYYSYLCGRCDSKCSKLGKKCLIRKHSEMNMENTTYSTTASNISQERDDSLEDEGEYQKQIKINSAHFDSDENKKNCCAPDDINKSNLRSIPLKYKSISDDENSMELCVQISTRL